MRAEWVVKRLDDIGTIQTGSTPKTSEKRNFGDFIPFIKPSDFNSDGSLHYENDGLSKMGLESARTVSAGSVLMVCIGATIGKCGFSERDVTTNQQINSLTPANYVSSKFVYYQMLTEDFQRRLILNSSQMTLPIINKSKWAALTILLPQTLSEQRQIVGILDEAFAGIATAKANAEKNLQNARALFESHLQAVFTQRSKGWVEKRLGDVVTRLTNGYVGPTRDIYHSSGVPYLLARHVKNNRLLFDGRTFIADEFNRKNKKSMLKANDVLLVQSGHIGHSAVVTKEHEGHNCHAMIVITPVEGEFIGPFLSLFFNSSGMKQKFQEIRSGSTVPHLTCGEVRELTIALPDLATQQRLVDRSRELDAETQRLESLYQRKLAALDELKKSLLHQAFTGQLMSPHIPVE